MSELSDERLESVSSDKRGTVWKLELFGQTVWISFTRKGYARGGDIHDGLQFNTVIFGRFLILRKQITEEISIESELHTGESITILKDIPHVFIALEDTLMIEWHDHKLPPYKDKRFYEPYRKFCLVKNIV